MIVGPLGRRYPRPFSRSGCLITVRINHSSCLDVLFDLEKWHAHLYRDGFCLLGSGDNAAVIVGQDDDCFPSQVWIEKSLTTHVEAVAVDETENPDVAHSCP